MFTFEKGKSRKTRKLAKSKPKEPAKEENFCRQYGASFNTPYQRDKVTIKSIWLKNRNSRQ